MTTSRSASAPVSVAALDDHAVVRAGLAAIVGAEPDLVWVGSAADEAGLWPLVHRARPSVVVLDVHHPGRDGLALTLHLKRQLHAPRVVLHSGPEAGDLTVAARFAGADALVAKADTRLALLRAIRGAATGDDGRSARPPLDPMLQARAAAGLDPVDRALFAMRLAGTPPGEIAQTLGLPVAALPERVEAVLAQLAGLRRPRQAGVATALQRSGRSGRFSARRSDANAMPPMTSGTQKRISR
jgi:DNA-binding NarL/FixJ family response regulator